MAETMRGSDAAGSTSESWSTRLRSRWSWRWAMESISMPDMRATTSARCTSIGDTSATTRPWRSTTMRSARLKTCSRSWVTSRMPAPASRISVMRRWTRSVSTTPSEAVGSSRMSRRGSGSKARPRATSCFWPRESVRAGPMEREAVGADPAQDRCRRVAVATLAEQPPLLAAEHDVGGHVEVVAHAVVLPQHLDPGSADQLRGRRHPHAVEAHLAVVGLDDPGDAPDERRLAGAGLADQRHHLAPADLRDTSRRTLTAP